MSILFALLMLALLMMVTTGATLAEACRDWIAVVRAGRNGLLLFTVRQSVRHEAFRLAKHALLVFGVGVIFHAWPNSERLRNSVILTVGMLLTLNSLLDLRARRRIRALTELKLARAGKKAA